ncbi:MAG TPA: hypothetical protein VEK06_03825, partial [Myxococcota bacterium]|nr:hypothetical protein [Myxococcota bacterium]
NFPTDIKPKLTEIDRKQEQANVAAQHAKKPVAKAKEVIQPEDALGWQQLLLLIGVGALVLAAAAGIVAAIVLSGGVAIVPLAAAVGGAIASAPLWTSAAVIGGVLGTAAIVATVAAIKRRITSNTELKRFQIQGPDGTDHISIPKKNPINPVKGFFLQLAARFKSSEAEKQSNQKSNEVEMSDFSKKAKKATKAISPPNAPKSGAGINPQAPSKHTVSYGPMPSLPGVPATSASTKLTTPAIEKKKDEEGEGNPPPKQHN